MSANTPGPWEADESGFIIDGDGERIAYTVQPAREFNKPEIVKQGEANAKLIAAAPDLLAALQGVLSNYDALGTSRVPCLVAARAAIAKATGEA